MNPVGRYKISEKKMDRTSVRKKQSREHESGWQIFQQEPRFTEKWRGSLSSEK